MKRFSEVTVRWLLFTGLLFGTGLQARVVAAYTIDGNIPEVAYHWQRPDLAWSDSGDDVSTGKTALPFAVTLGGKTFDSFDMNSNGYVELLSGTEIPTDLGFGSVDYLIGTSASSTYLLAAYDDLSSEDFGAYGYDDSSPGQVTFDYLTETYSDESSFYLNNFELILHQDGTTDWNFRFADYSGYDNDLFSGLYLGHTETLLRATDNEIPELTSYRYTPGSSGSTSGHSANPVPEPGAFLLFPSGLAVLFAVTRRRDCFQA